MGSLQNFEVDNQMTLFSCCLMNLGVMLFLVFQSESQDASYALVDALLADVSVVPFVGIRHVVACTSAKGRLAVRQRALDGVDGEKGVAHVPFHVLIRVGVVVLLGNVLVERPYLGSGALVV